MKERKASSAMEHIDEKLILAAMDDTDLKGKVKRIDLGGQKRMTKRTLFKIGTIAAALVLVLSAVLIIGGSIGKNSGAVVAIDVNPSIELEINKKEKVEEVRALNAEAEAVLKGMDLEGVDINIAVNAIIGSMVKNNYLSDEKNSVLLSIDSENTKLSEALKADLKTEIDSALGKENITASVLIQYFDKNGDEKDKAEKNHISTAKAALISKIVSAELLDAGGVPYTYEKLSKLNVHELKLILESKRIDVAGVDRTGEASLKNYKSADEALAAALESAGLTKENITRLEIELDFDDDVNAVVYEIEFRSADKKYEYELLAETAVVIETEIKTVDQDDDDEKVAPPENAISREAALNACYEDADVRSENVRRPEIELELENGIYVYEIEFKSGEKEYEYTVNALTGEILERESEPID